MRVTAMHQLSRSGRAPKRSLVLGVTLVALISAPFVAVAHSAGATTAPAQPAAPQSPKTGKLSPRLSVLASNTTFASPRARAAALSVPITGVGSLPVRSDGRVMVEIRTADTSAAAINVLRGLHAHVVNVSSAYSTVTAAVAPGDLPRIAALSDVHYVSEVLAPQVGQTTVASSGGGSASPNVCAPIVSEGDALMNVAAARAANNLDGAGQTIGILSDSFDTDTTAATHAAGDIASGELPGAANPCGHTTPVTVQQDYSGGGQTDEGRAMTQLAHGLAPGANLAFATAARGSLDFASQITNLRTVQHASILVDDSGYLDEPFFQDGPIANAVNASSAAGVPFFSAAGNSNVIVGGNNVSSYEAASLRTVTCPSQVSQFEPVQGCHDFDTTTGTDTGDDITVAPGGGFGIDLQWAQPLGGVTSDYEVFIANAAGTIVGGSDMDNLASQEPFEFGGYTNSTASPQTVHVIIAKYSGANTRLKFVLMGADGITNVQYNASTGGDIVGPSIFGHSGTSTVGSTAAVPYDNSDTSEDYSSRGPVTLYFQPAPSHTAVASPQVLNQPTFAATDNVQTSFFAEQVGGVWRFAGTSAAAPQAAAIGALLHEKAPGLSSAQLMGVLSTTARPVATNGTPDAVGGGYLDADAALASVASLPSAPSTVSRVNDDSQVTVNWSGDATTDPNFPITGFIVTPYLNGVAQSPASVDASTTSHLFSGLTNGGTYTFTVATTNANATGPESAPSAAVVVGIPGPPTGVTGTAGVNQATVSWSAPTPDGLTITGYSVATLVGGVTQTTQAFPTTATSQTITGLSNNTTYMFRVAVTNGYGTGLYSAPSSPTTVGVPDPPTGVTATTGAGGFMGVHWTVPSNNGSPITSYVITPYLNGTTPMATKTIAPASNTSISGLTAGQSYTFTVAAGNVRGLGSPSAPSAAVIEGSPPAPGAPTATPGNGSATVSWLVFGGIPGAPDTSYTIRAYNGATPVAVHVYPAPAASQVFTGLTNGTTYRFTAAAQNANGLGAESALGNATTVGSPAAPTVTAVPGNARATVNWTASATNGSAVTSYVVTPYLAGVAQSPHSFAATARTATITGLTNGSTYSFTVTGRNTRGTGAESASVGVTVGSPLAPTAPTAKPGDQQATVHWTAPTVTNGAAVTGYVVTVFRNGIAQMSVTFASAATTEIVTTLGNAQQVVFKVSAVNARGEGPQSVGSPPIIVGAPTAPTGVTATALHASATVKWTKPATNGALISGYTVIPYIGTVAQTPRTFNGSTTTRTISGLTTGKQYTFKVKATNSRGVGPLSVASNAVTIT